MIIIILFLFGLGFWGTWAVTSDIQWGILALVCYEGCIYFNLSGIIHFCVTLIYGVLKIVYGFFLGGEE